MTDELRHLDIETPVLVQLLPDGLCLAQSVARARLVAFGSEAAVLDEHRRFLERYLLEVNASEVAAFDLPADLSLLEVVTHVARLDLPLSLRRPISFEIPIILASSGPPRGRAVWCIAPTLDHTFFVPTDADRDAAIAAELARIVAAADPADIDLRRLLPCDESWLETIRVELLVGESGLAGRARAARRKAIASQKESAARATLAQISTLLKPSTPSPRLLFRDAELSQIGDRLRGAARRSTVIVGDESVGKSALFLSWLASEPRRADVYAVSMAQLIAGASGFGEWQERVGSMLEAAERLDAVLFFENFGELFGDRTSGSDVDVIGALRAHITQERVRIVGEINTDRYENARKLEPGLLAQITAIRLEALDADKTVTIAEDRIALWKKSEPRALPVLAAIAEPVVRLTKRYLPYRSFPGKAIRFLDELRASRDADRDASGLPRPIDLDDAYDAFAQSTGIPRFLLRRSEPLVVAELIDSFRRTMIGQDEAVTRVAQTLCMVKAELQPARKPLSTFLFVGPTGVGKTELARTLAAVLFGAPDRLVRFDMSEFADPAAGARLILGDSGYGGLLTSRVRETPFCVLLLDEIEKAHRAVHDLLLQVCGSGRLTDGRGRTTIFENTIIIMTSNLGASHRLAEPGPSAKGPAALSERHSRAIADAFRPEMLGRIDAIVGFEPLAPSEVAAVAEIAVRKIAERRGFTEAGINLVVSPRALAELAARGDSQVYGVRALRRYLEAELVTPIAHLLAKHGSAARGALASVTLASEPPAAGTHPDQRLERSLASDGTIAIELYRREGLGARLALRGIAAIAAARRAGDKLTATDEVDALRERLAELRGQLATISSPKGRRRQPKRQAVLSAQIATLQTEHHRLAAACDRVFSAQADLHASEELAITTLIAGGDPQECVAPATDAYRELRVATFWLLTSDLSRRRHCSFRLTRTGASQPTREWLLELCAFAAKRGDQLTGRRRRPPTASQPCPWTASISAADLATAAASDMAALNPLLIDIVGKDAGVLYPVEAGLHRFHGYGDDDQPAHLLLELLSLDKDVPDHVLADSSIIAGPPAYIPRSAPAIRERYKGGDAVSVGDASVMIEAGYFQALEDIALEHLLDARGRPSGIAGVYAAYADSHPDPESEAPP